MPSSEALPKLVHVLMLLIYENIHNSKHVKTHEKNKYMKGKQAQLDQTVTLYLIISFVSVYSTWTPFFKEFKLLSCIHFSVGCQQ